MRRLHAGLPPSTLFVIDAAYAEYVQRNDYEAGIEMVSQFDNVVMTRTFSKIHGLAGLRVGWAFGPAAVADVLNRIRGPVQRVGAAAARGRGGAARPAHLEGAVAHNEKWKSWLTDEIRKLGLRVDDSVANFMLIHFPPDGTAHGQSGRRVSVSAGPDLARRSAITVCRMPASHHRQRRREPPRRRGARRIHEPAMTVDSKPFGKSR